jgi:acyl homoserine lactone synthase
MIDAISLETAHLLGDALPSAHRLRHRIFIERQKYEVSTWRGMEWDQFDTPAAVYLLWRDEACRVRALARLIPTSLPYMIQQLWPELVANGDLPAADDVWEVSRFGSDRDLDRERRALACGELFCALAEFGLQRGIREYVFVTPAPMIENAIGRAGVPWQRLGEPRKLGSMRVVAARSAVSEDALSRLRRHHRIDAPVLRLAGDDEAPAAQTATPALRPSQKPKVTWRERVSTALRLDPERLPRPALPGALSCRSMRALSMNQWA